MRHRLCADTHKRSQLYGIREQPSLSSCLCHFVGAGRTAQQNSSALVNVPMHNEA